jgi:hypothetical protein
VGEDELPDKLSLHLLAKTDIAGTKGHPSEHTMPCLRRERAEGRGEDRKDGEDDEGGNAEHLEGGKDFFERIEEFLNVRRSVIEPKRDAKEWRELQLMLQVAVATEVAAAAHDVLLGQIQCKLMCIDPIDVEADDGGGSAIEKVNPGMFLQSSKKHL